MSSTPTQPEHTSDPDEHGPVLIELSQTQIDQVTRSASSSGGNISTLLSGLDGVRERIGASPRMLDDRQLSHSLLAGLLVLATFPLDGDYLGGAQVARTLDMHTSTTHRYVSTPLTRRAQTVG
jgi:hypothetical protein